MTDKELRSLKRQALLELLLEKTIENEKLTAELEEANRRLSQREIAVNEAGTLAEAALSINGMLTAADESARQYLENIQQAEERCREMTENAQREADAIIRRARKQAKKIRDAASTKAAPKPEKIPEKEIPKEMPEEPPKETVSEAEPSETERSQAELSQEFREKMDRALEQMRKKNGF